MRLSIRSSALPQLPRRGRAASIIACLLSKLGGLQSAGLHPGHGERTALTWSASYMLDICSTNLRVIFQNRCWSPSSANRLPDEGSQSPDNRISTCTYRDQELGICASRVTGMQASHGSASHQALLFPCLDGFPGCLSRMRQCLRKRVWQHLTELSSVQSGKHFCNKIFPSGSHGTRTSSALLSGDDDEVLGSSSAPVAESRCLLGRHARYNFPRAIVEQPSLGEVRAMAMKDDMHDL